MEYIPSPTFSCLWKSESSTIVVFGGVYKEVYEIRYFA